MGRQINKLRDHLPEEQGLRPLLTAILKERPNFISETIFQKNKD